MHVPAGSTVADPTFGRGGFWKLVPPGRYNVLASDLRDGIDLRALPYADGSVDALTLDPPYAEGHLRSKPATRMSLYREHYAASVASGDEHWYPAVLALYRDGLYEARRILRPGGVAIVKCQDQVSSNRLRLLHVDVIRCAEQTGFRVLDLFTLVRPGRPPATPGQFRQVHARRNCSMFLVFEL